MELLEKWFYELLCLSSPRLFNHQRTTIDAMFMQNEGVNAHISEDHIYTHRSSETFGIEK